MYTVVVGGEELRKLGWKKGYSISIRACTDLRRLSECWSNIAAAAAAVAELHEDN